MPYPEDMALTILIANVFLKKEKEDMKIIQAFILVVLLNSCALKPLIENPKEIEFCDIPKYLGKQVYITCKYSGLDEYWSLSSLNGKCNNEIRVQFDDKIPLIYRLKFNKVHNHYFKYYLILELVGSFETGEQYGHVGSNNYYFNTKHMISARLVRKKHQEKKNKKK